MRFEAGEEWPYECWQDPVAVPLAWRIATQRRADGRCKAQARLFVRWLLEGVPVHQIGVARTSFARKTSWCWSVEVPKPLTTGEVCDQVLLDGIYLPYGWCLIIATNGRQVIAWQWCARENTAAYCALMERILAPRVVVTDGGAGIHKALKNAGLIVRFSAACSTSARAPSPTSPAIPAPRQVRHF